MSESDGGSPSGTEDPEKVSCLTQYSIVNTYLLVQGLLGDSEHVLGELYNRVRHSPSHCLKVHSDQEV